MVITKHLTTWTIFSLTGHAFSEDKLTDQNFLTLSGLMRLGAMGSISKKNFERLFLEETNKILIRIGLITEPIKAFTLGAHDTPLCLN